VCAISNTPFLLIVYAERKKKSSIFLYLSVNAVTPDVWTFRG